MNSQIGLVFIHGAGLGNYCWEDVVEHLQYPYLLIEFPNRENTTNANKDLNLDDYIQAAKTQIDNWEVEEFVLVVHSAGGIIGLSLLEHLGSKLKGFIAISAILPPSGKSFVSCLHFPQSVLMPIILSLAGTKPPDNIIEKELCNDLTSEQATKVIERFTPESKLLYTTKLHYQLPECTFQYIQLSEDKSLTLAFQQKMAKTLPSPEFSLLESGHLPMLSKPIPLSELINGFVDRLK